MAVVGTVFGLVHKEVRAPDYPGLQQRYFLHSPPLLYVSINSLHGETGNLAGVRTAFSRNGAAFGVGRREGEVGTQGRQGFKEGEVRSSQKLGHGRKGKWEQTGTHELPILGKLESGYT